MKLTLKPLPRYSAGERLGVYESIARVLCSVNASVSFSAESFEAKENGRVLWNDGWQIHLRPDMPITSEYDGLCLARVCCSEVGEISGDTFDVELQYRRILSQALACNITL